MQPDTAAKGCIVQPRDETSPLFVRQTMGLAVWQSAGQLENALMTFIGEPFAPFDHNRPVTRMTGADW